jgi:dipeptidyl aminopeptidase/acylaminoacyl peptidase
LLAAALAAGSAAPAWAAAPAGIPASHFFQDPQFSAAALSPDARYLAVRTGAEGRRLGLAVIDLQTSKVEVVAQYGDADVRQFYWINDTRLVYDMGDKQRAPGDRRAYPGIYAVNHDGSGQRQLALRTETERNVSSRLSQRALPSSTQLLGQAGAQDSEWVYAVRPVWDEDSLLLEHLNLVRINTLTGLAEDVKRPVPMQDWLLDQQGVPRLAMSLQDGKRSVHYLDPAGGAWRTVSTFDAYGNTAGSYQPLGFGPAGKLLVSAHNGQDKESLRTLDLATGELGKEALVALKDFDFSATLVYTQGKLAGYEVLADGRTMVWLDPQMQALQKAVDALLPGTINLVTPAARPQAPWVLVRSYSDQQPSIYLLYNTATGKLRPVGATHPQINAADMAQMDLKHYQARDGMTVPAWLTLPKGQKKNLPLVVLAHGGPYVRGNELNWDAEVQFLASRGYAVLQPEFRGSTGYGAQHFRAGWKQWGLAMQDDITDAARWAIAQGIADPKRICLAGANYGGYATLMGLLKEPQLFKCGVSWAGVSDIGLLYTDSRAFMSDLPQAWKQYGMPQLVGDLVQDAAQLKATSPLEQAARIKQPLLLAHGTDDRRVPIQHSRLFHAAVKPGNPDATLVEYTGEEHGWSLPKTRIDFWTRVEKFLGRHIGPQP